MLRKQLILRLGLVVIALVAVAFAGIWLLRGAFDELNRIDAQRARITEAAQDLARHMDDLEALLLGQTPVGTCHEMLAQIDISIVSLDAFLISGAQSGQSRAAHARLIALDSTLAADIQAYLNAGTTDVVPVRDEALRTLLGMRREASLIPLLENGLASAQRGGVISRVHAIAVWLGVSVVVLAAAAGLVLYSTVRLVLRPVGALLKVSRELSQEHFHARVPSGQPVEFAELASAYNLLAARIEQSEKRTLVTLQQLALTLNHELNNAFAIVEMQLERLKRRNPDDPTLGLRLKEIRQTLGRMTVTVQSLTNLKRVVLTDYRPGQKMLDLAKSIAVDETTGSKEWIKAEVKITPRTSQTSARSS